MPLNENETHPRRTECTIKPGERISFCRCWQSKNFPFCDGSHRDYNAVHNDHMGPAVVICEGTSETES